MGILDLGQIWDDRAGIVRPVTELGHKTWFRLLGTLDPGQSWDIRSRTELGH